MKLVVYKGFNEEFLSMVKEEPLVDGTIATKLNVLEFDKKTRKQLDMALISLEESDEVWVTYSEYTLIKNRVDDAIEEDGLELIIFTNNLYPDYYPLPFELTTDLIDEIEKNLNSDSTDDCSKECQRYSNNTEDLSDASKRAEILERISWDDLDFDDVIIDEAQDFHDREIVYFKEYAELKDGRFLAFFDKNQVVQTENVPEWVEKSECRLLLTKNCRNTYEIALTAYNVIDVELNQKIQMMNGEKTSLAFVKGDPMGKLVKLLRMLTGDKYGYDYSDIVILTLKTESESIMNNISKISGIPITREKSNSSILFTTAKKFKGLESRVIIIVDIDESSFNDEKEKRNFYVACSRATQYLSLIVEGDDQKIKSIADVIAGPNFAPKGKIAMKTQATPLRLD